MERLHDTYNIVFFNSIILILILIQYFKNDLTDLELIVSLVNQQKLRKYDGSVGECPSQLLGFVDSNPGHISQQSECYTYCQYLR